MDYDALLPFVLALAFALGVWGHFRPGGSWRQSLQHFALLTMVAAPAFVDAIPEHPARIPGVAALWLLSVGVWIWCMRADRVERHRALRASITGGEVPGDTAVRTSELRDLNAEERRARWQGLGFAALGGALPLLMMAAMGHPLVGLGVGAMAGSVAGGMMYLIHRPIRSSRSQDKETAVGDEADSPAAQVRAQDPLAQVRTHAPDRAETETITPRGSSAKER